MIINDPFPYMVLNGTLKIGKEDWGDLREIIPSECILKGRTPKEEMSVFSLIVKSKNGSMDLVRRTLQGVLEFG